MRSISTLILSLSLLLISVGLSAQNNVGIGTANPNPSSILEMQSDNQGLLIPRMTTAKRSAISNPVDGLMVYDIDSSCFYYFKAGAWSSLCGGGSGSVVQQTLGRWDTTGTADIAYGSTGTTGNFNTIQDMALTFTPTKSVVYVSASISGDVTVQAAPPSTGDVSIVNVRMRSSNQGIIAGCQSLAAAVWVNADSAFKVPVVFTSSVQGSDTISASQNRMIFPIATATGGQAWNANISKAVRVTPGVPVTISLEWAVVFGGQKSGQVRCRPTSDRGACNRNIIVWE